MDRIAGLAARRLPNLDHFDGRRFFNPHVPIGRRRSAIPRWRRTRLEPWPDHVKDPIPAASPRSAELNIDHLHRPFDILLADRRRPDDQPDLVRTL